MGALNFYNVSDLSLSHVVIYNPIGMGISATNVLGTSKLSHLSVINNGYLCALVHVEYIDSVTKLLSQPHLQLRNVSIWYELTKASMKGCASSCIVCFENLQKS